MPTYQYQCDECGNSFDRFQKFSEDALTTCPACGGPIRRVIGNVGLVFKGSGWYINDSRPMASESAPAGDAAKPGADKAAEPAASTTEAPAAKADAPSEKKAKPAAAPAAS
jgi:putative FmdB family regulatory protein